MNTYPEYKGVGARSASKILMSCLPGPFGTIIDELLFGVAEQIKANRLELFSNELDKKVSQIDKSLQTDYIKSEDFYDLTIKTFSTLFKTKSEEKIKYLCTVYCDAIENQFTLDDNLTEVMISYLDTLTKNHLIIFKFIVENITKYKHLDSYEKLFNDFIVASSNVDLDKYVFRMYLRDLENKTLIRFGLDINEYDSTGGYIALEDTNEIDAIILTPIGEHLIKIMNK